MRKNTFANFVLPFKRFQVKVSLILILSILFVLFFNNMLTYRASTQAQFNELRNKLMVTAQSAALLVDVQKLMSIPLTHEGEKTKEYEVIRNNLLKMKDVNPRLKYIYTMRKTENEGIWQFVVDANPYPEEGIEEDLTSLPGDEFDVSRYPEMMKAFDGPAADKKLEVDEWGVFISGYAPLRNKKGQAVAMLGIDVEAKQVYAIQQKIKNRMILVSLFGVLLALTVGTLFTKTITTPIDKLAFGIRRIAEGDLNYRVPVQGDDEISNLTKSFNDMASTLFKSRQRLLRYFHDIVRSMVRVLEARDQYTRGHSEAVGELAGRIALKLGIPRDDVKFFKKMAVLHDLGKIGISDKILNKPDKLTDEEWAKIKEHPIIGEEILEPVLDDKDMLKIVRHHHERFDGTGYPDQLPGEKINVLAAIVAVADAYHAMTSDRSYRKALDKNSAVEEIKRHSGTQFNPKVVDAFLEVVGKSRRTQ